MSTIEKIGISLLTVAVIITSAYLILPQICPAAKGGTSVHGMELIMNDDAILDMADIIIEAKNIKMVDEIEYCTENVNAIVYIYSADVLTNYYGDYKSGDTIYISYGGTILPEGINEDTNMVLLLKDNTLNYYNNDVYSFVSISQGIFLETKNTTQKAYGLSSNDSKMINNLGKEFNPEEVQHRYEGK